MTGLAPEVPFGESTPELWIEEDHDEAKAHEIVSDLKSASAPVGEKWKCLKCGEESEPGFTSCWNCGQPRTAA